MSTGLRRGEICGLKWSDINVESCVLTVRRSLSSVGHDLLIKPPKSGKGRLVTLPAYAVIALHDHHAKQDREKDETGIAYEDRGWVLAHPHGDPIHPDQITTQFRRAAAAAGIPGLCFHDLLHLHASLLMQQGIHPKIISERLGHSTIGITLDIYSHVIPGMQEEATMKMDRLFGDHPRPQRSLE